jgi:hypothetical protein
MEALKGVRIWRPRGHLMKWLEVPKVDWDLPLELIDEVKNAEK